MVSLDKMIEVGSLLNPHSAENKVINLSTRKRIIMKEMRELNNFTGPEFEKLYSEWSKVNGY